MNATTTMKARPFASGRSINLTKQILEYQSMPNGEEKKKLCNQIMANNEHLIFEVTKRYKGRAEEEDLLQEARLGFYMAMQTFDATKEVNFTTYCIEGIQIAIYKFLERQVNPIRITARMFKKANHLNYVTNHLEQVLKRTPSISELSKATGFSESEIQEIRLLPHIEKSLDMPILDVEGLEIKDTIEDPDSCLFQEKIEDEDERETKLSIIFSQLTDREKTILMNHLGQGKTLNEISKKLQVSRERVRQIESRAIQKIKNSYYVVEKTKNSALEEVSEEEEKLCQYLQLVCTKNDYFIATHMLCLKNAEYISMILLRDVCHVNVNKALDILQNDPEIYQLVKQIKKGKNRREQIYASNRADFYQGLQCLDFTKEEIDNSFQTLSNGAQILAHYFYGDNLELSLDWSSAKNGSQDLLLSEFVFRPIYAKMLYYREFGCYPNSKNQKDDENLKKRIVSKNISLDKIPVLEINKSSKHLVYGRNKKA